MTAGRVVAGLLLLALLPGCSPDEAPVPSGASAAPAAADCPDGPAEAGVCRLIQAVQSDDQSELSAAERKAAAAAQSDVPDGGWTAACELLGDVTVLCEVTFAAADELLGFHVFPVNLEYVDGELIPPEGEVVRYEVTEYLGTGSSGSFGQPG
jgi:hypothetical protein